jgi:hypothetical protein
MHVQSIFAVFLIGLTLLFVLGVVLFRLLWSGSKQKKDTARKTRS